MSLQVQDQNEHEICELDQIAILQVIDKVFDVYAV